MAFGETLDPRRPQMAGAWSRRYAPRPAGQLMAAPYRGGFAPAAPPGLYAAPGSTGLARVRRASRLARVMRPAGQAVLPGWSPADARYFTNATDSNGHVVNLDGYGKPIADSVADTAGNRLPDSAWSGDLLVNVGGESPAFYTGPGAAIQGVGTTPGTPPVPGTPGAPPAGDPFAFWNALGQNQKIGVGVAVVLGLIAAGLVVGHYANPKGTGGRRGARRNPSRGHRRGRRHGRRRHGRR